MNEAPVGSAAESLSNRGFLLALLQAALALILSALLLITLYIGFSPLLAEQRAQATREDARPWTFRGTELVARMGRGQPTEDGSLRVIELERGIDHRAIFTRRARFNAEDYPFLEYTIANRHAGENIYFIWRTAAAPEEVGLSHSPRRPPAAAAAPLDSCCCCCGPSWPPLAEGGVFSSLALSTSNGNKPCFQRRRTASSAEKLLPYSTT